MSPLKVSVDQIGLPGTTFQQDLDLLRRLGVGAVGVLRQKLAPVGAEAGARALADAGLTVSVLLGAGGFPLEHPGAWAGPFDDARRALDEAAAVGAPRLLLTSGPAGSLSYEEAEARFREILAALLPEAADRGVGILFEPNNALRVDLGYVHTLHDALDLADSIDSPVLTVLAEVNNCWIERHLYDNIARRVARIGLVQISDFAPGTMYTPHRVPLGEGMIPLGRIIGALADAGYDGYHDIEVLGPAVDEMGGEESTRRSLQFISLLGLP